MKTLMEDYGMSRAKEIVLTGCSAGGLGAFYHADYLGDFFTKNIPSLQKYKVIPISGFFLRHETVEKKTVYEDQMRNL